MRNTKISPETENKINCLHKQLLTATKPAPELSTFLEVREACRDAKELAADAPEGVKLLTPQFVSLLSREQRRSMEASSSQILFGGLSTDIRILAVEVIAKLAGPSLVREYEATESLHRLITVLAQAVTATDTQMPASRALGEVALVRPEAVADSLAQEEMISDIVTATGWPLINIKNIDQTLFRLLVVLTERYPSQIPSTDTVRTGAEAAVLIKLLYAQKLATNTRIREEKKSLSESELMEKFAGSGPTDALTEYIHSAVDRDDDAARILGKVVAASDVTGQEIPLELVNRVRSTEGFDREKAAQVLGEVVAVDGATAQEKSKELVNRVQSSDYGDKKRAAIALGEIAVAGDATAEEVPQELINRVQSETGVDRVFAAGMLGRVVAAGKEHTEETFQELVDKVRFAKKGSSNREKEAQALGVVVAASDVTDQEIPLELVNRVRSSEGKNRRRAARVLGEVVAEKKSLPKKSLRF